MNPLVSVLTPTYGRPELLRRAVRIFLAYTYSPKEMVIVDDSEKRADLPRSPLVRYVRLQERRNLGDKHNLAASLAQGDVLMHQDDDDLYSPRRIARQVQPIALEEADVAGFLMNFIRDERTGRFFHFRGGAVFGPPSQTHSPLYRFHDSNAAFRRGIWDAGIQYSRERVAQKLHLLNDALRAGYRFSVLENRGDFVYSRHAVNTWQFGRDVLVQTPAPSFAREAWFRNLTGAAA